MKRFIAIAILIVLSLANIAEARRVKRVVVRGPRVRVTVRPGFPIRRAIPNVVVRPGAVVRVAPRAYLAPVVFTAAVVASLPSSDWKQSEGLDREDGWTDFTMDVDRRGNRLFLQIEEGAAQISFVEVVFENGETQVVDFNDRAHARGVYSLLDFKNGRKVDHVRIVAKAAGEETQITLHLAG